MVQFCLVAFLQYVRFFCSPPSRSFLFALDCFKLLMNFFTHTALFFSSLNFPQCVVLETKEEAAVVAATKNILTVPMINACCVIRYNLVTSSIAFLLQIFFFLKKISCCMSLNDYL